LALGIGSVSGWIARSPMLVSVIKDWRVPPKQAFGQKSSIVLLLLGCDEDRFFHGTYLHGSNIIPGREYARSDMMLLTKLDFDNNRITALSIPRDTMFGFPGHKKRKINAYFSIATFDKNSSVPVLTQRASLTQKAVEGLLAGVHVDQSVVLNFQAFQSLVDLVGGVDIDVPKKMDYDDKAGYLHIHLKPGLQHLDGDEAIGFVRFRHDSESDFGRQERQKEFMLAFKKGVLSNFGRLPEVVEGSKKVFNESLNDAQIRALFTFARQVPPANIQMGMVPVVEKHRDIYLDKAKTPAALRTFGFLDG
jgi:LCP family protein required for cell wall assembly